MNVPEVHEDSTKKKSLRTKKETIIKGILGPFVSPNPLANITPSILWLDHPLYGSTSIEWMASMKKCHNHTLTHVAIEQSSD